MNHEEVSLSPKKVLIGIHANLDTQFFGDSRDKSKQLFKTLDAGDSVPFMRIFTGEAGEVDCTLGLDKSLYQGKLNYGRFRKILAYMLHTIQTHIEADRKINTLSSNTGEVLFNLPGIAKFEDGDNVLVCSMQATGPGLATIRLMFLDPTHYAQALQSAAGQQAS